MSAAKAVRARLIAVTAVTDLVGTRIYPDALKQGTAYPAIRFQAFGLPPEHAMGADTSCRTSRVQVDAYGLTKSSTEAVATAIYDALSRFGGTAGGVVVQQIFSANGEGLSDFEPMTGRTDGVTGAYRKMLDFMVHYEV